MRRDLDIAHADSAVGIIKSFRALVEELAAQPIPDPDKIAVLVERMESHLRDTPKSRSTAAWQVAVDALRLLHGQSRCREIARNGTGDIVNERARVAVLFQEFQTHLAALSMDDRIEDQFAVGIGGPGVESLDAQRLIAFLHRWPLPVTYWKKTPWPFPVVQRSGAEDTEELLPSPIVRVIASLDDAPWVSPQLLHPQLLYSLKFTLRGIGWEVVPHVVEIENGGSSSPGGVARTFFYQERGDRHEERVQQSEAS